MIETERRGLLHGGNISQRGPIQGKTMIVRLLDLQDEANPANGSAMADSEQLSRMLESLRTRTPFFAELTGEHDDMLVIGIGGRIGCVQYNRVDGSPPYLMAVAANPTAPNDGAGFLAGGTLSPIPARYILPFETAKEIAIHFQQTGARSAAVCWEELDPALR